MNAATAHRRTAARWGIGTGLMVAGAGAGLAAALATSTSTTLRAAGGAAGGAAGLAAAISADRAQARSERRAAALARRDRALHPVTTPAPATDRSVLGLLSPTRQHAPPFRGRAAALAWLTAWRDDPAGHPAAQLSGAAGTGKTRLAVQAALTLPPGWHAGWLAADAAGADAIEAVTACGQPALILADNAAQHPAVPALLSALASRHGSPAVRVLLITRTPEELRTVTEALPGDHQWLLDPASLPARQLGLFGTDADHARWTAEAVRAYAAARRTPPPDLPAALSQPADTPAAGPIIAVHARAALLVLDSEQRRPLRPPGLSTTPPLTQVSTALLDYEKQHWHHTATASGAGLAGTSAATLDAAIAALAATAAATPEQAATALRGAVPDLAGAPGLASDLTRWAASLYPLPLALQPALIHETFITESLTASPALTAYARTLPAPAKTTLLATLARAADHHPGAAPLHARITGTDTPGLLSAAITTALTATTGRPRLDTHLAALIPASNLPDGQLADLHDHAGWQLPRTRAALAARDVDRRRRDGHPPGLTDALTTLGTDLSSLGCHHEALDAFQEALALCQELAAVNPAHQPNLAAALNNLGLALCDLGRHHEAVGAFRETVVLYRELAAASPDRYRPDLADSMTSLGISLRNAGRHQEALGADQEALARYRELAAADPVHRPGLARSLANIGIGLHDAGRRREAVDTFREALSLHRELAAADPAHRPGLARGLANLGLSLRDAGRHQEALDPGQEAIALHRELAASNPAHQAELASSLTNLGTSLHDAGRHHEALDTFQEAIAFYRELVVGNLAHQPGLAASLTGLGTSLRGLGRHREALDADQEALALYLELAAGSPAHQPGLANSVTNLGISLHNLGRRHEALDTFQEALTRYRELAAGSPAHQPGLAASLTNLGTSLRGFGRHREALDADREAVMIYRQLAAADSALYEEEYRRQQARLDRDQDRHDSTSGKAAADDPRDQPRSTPPAG